MENTEIIKTDELPIDPKGIRVNSNEITEYDTSNTPSIVFMDRRQPFFTQSSTIGNESQLGRNWFLRHEKQWTWKNISEMFEKFGVFHRALVRRGNKKYSHGFDVVIPSEKNNADSTHKKAMEIYDIVQQYSIYSKMAMGDVAVELTGGFVFFLQFNDAKTAKDFIKPVKVTKNLVLNDIDIYTKREIEPDGIIRDVDTGKIKSYKMRLNCDDAHKDVVVEVNASRIVEYFYNPTGYHVNGLTKSDSTMGSTDELRNLIGNIAEVIFRHVAPYTKIYHPENLSKDSKALLDDIGTQISHGDLIKIPTGPNGEKIWDIIHDSDFTNIPNVKPLIDFIVEMTCASWGMSKSEVFGYEGTTSSSPTAVLDRLTDLVAELNLYSIPFLYKLFKRLEDFNIIKDKTRYELIPRSLYEETKQQEALNKFYYGQTGNLIYAQKIGYKFDEYGRPDFGTLKYSEVQPPQEAPPEKPQQLPKSYTDLPGTKPTIENYKVDGIDTMTNPKSKEEKELIDEYFKGGN